MYTIQDLENARANLQRCVAAFDTPLETCREQASAAVRAASAKVQEIETYLKMHGIIELTDRQRLEAALETQFPNAEHLQIVEYQGGRYQMRYYPEQKYQSGWGVKKWGKRWEQLTR